MVQALTSAGAQAGNAAGVIATLAQGDPAAAAAAAAAAASAALGGAVGAAGGVVPGIAGKAASGVLQGVDLPFFEDKAITSMAGKAAQAIGGIAGAVAGAAGDALRKVLGGGDGNLEAKVASGDELHVRRFSVLERLSSLFEVSLLVRSENPSIDFDAVVGQPARFSLHSGPHDRFWAGLCNHMELAGVDPDGLSTYQITIVPALWLLSQRKNYRMFQQISEPDIVLRILEEWGIEPEVRIDKAAYKKRKYRVQYAESDLAFVHRMLEDAGIGYFFEQVKGESKLVLSDAPQSNPARQPPLPFTDDVTAVRTVEVEHATAVRMSQRVRPGKVTLRDHDYRRPAGYKLLKTAATGRGVEEKLERYHYTPGAFLFGAEQGDATPVADDKGKARTDEREGALVAQKRLDAKRGTARVCSFDTNAHDLAPGVVVSIVGHPHAALGRKLLIVQSSLAGSDRGEWSHQCEARGVDIPYRPELVTPKPRVNGVESATVVGPPGEEIHTDEFGRVRVHFHWDRESKMDDGSSCWIHVSQPWGGAGYGASNLPRVGQEVLVDFLGGDPDRPVIVGRVYTNLQKTPYKLPDNKTQSGWKSNSTGGGGGYNEIMFEDAAGRELVNIQAQKDLKKLVKNNESVTIGNNRTKLVKANDSLTVGANRSHRVKLNEQISVGLNQTVSVGINRATQVGAIDSTMVGASHSVMVSPPGEGGGGSTSIVLQHNKIELSTADGAKISMDGSTIKLDAETICLCSPGQITVMGDRVTVVGNSGVLVGAKRGEVGIKGGPLVKVRQLLEVTPDAIKRAVEQRIQELKAAGLSPDNTSVYSTLDAIGTIMGNETNRATIEEMASRYGLPPQLLAGVVASEMDFDHSQNDVIQDGLGRSGIDVGNGPGIASVHQETLDAAIAYAGENSLLGHDHAAAYDMDIRNRASFNGSVEAAAIVTAMYAHAKGGANSPADMATVWGAYRTGVEGVGTGGGGYTLDGYRNNRANGTENFPAQFQAGTNAYMSQPLFEYFDFLFSALPDKCC